MKVCDSVQLMRGLATIFWFASALSSYATANVTIIDGFVTKIDSPNEFAIGDVRIKMTSTTQCRLRDSFLESPLPAGWYSWSKETNLGYTHDGGRTSSATCRQGLLEVLSRVHVIATNASGTPPLLAKEITAVRVHVRLHAPIDLHDGFILEEGLPGGVGETAWMDGYPVAISPQSTLVAEPCGSGVTFQFHLRSVEARMSSHPQGCGLDNSSISLRANDAVLLDARWSDNPLDKPLLRAGNVLSSRRIAYMRQHIDPSEQGYIAQFVPSVREPDYIQQTFGTIQYPSAPAIRILPASSIQRWIRDLGNSLTPDYQKQLTDSDPTKLHLKFYVVHAFPSHLGDYFVQDSPMTPQYQLLHWDKDSAGYYTAPAKGALVDWIISSPDGTILIPDSVLSKFSNVAQVATMLSAAITSVLQRQEYHAWPAVLVPNTFKRNAIRGSQTERLSINEWQNTQAIRVGIRQMYLAGYDIRQAPFAWAIALNQPVVNPMWDEKHPDLKIPWYSSYAFSCVSQYYKDVDYSELKRGRAEYQQLLGELRKADPAAFAAKK